MFASIPRRSGANLMSSSIFTSLASEMVDWVQKHWTKRLHTKKNNGVNADRTTHQVINTPNRGLALVRTLPPHQTRWCEQSRPSDPTKQQNKRKESQNVHTQANDHSCPTVVHSPLTRTLHLSKTRSCKQSQISEWAGLKEYKSSPPALVGHSPTLRHPRAAFPHGQLPEQVRLKTPRNCAANSRSAT